MTLNQNDLPPTELSEETKEHLRQIEASLVGPGDPRLRERVGPPPATLPACMMPDGAEPCGSYTGLREALTYFADLDAMNPPPGVALNVWLPAVTAARAALRNC
jgi:hypothetical protein